jgi:hypothetical protein
MALTPQQILYNLVIKGQNEIASLQQQHQAEIASLQQQHQAKIASLQQQHQADLVSLHQKNETLRWQNQFAGIRQETLLAGCREQQIQFENIISSLQQQLKEQQETIARLEESIRSSVDSEYVLKPISNPFVWMGGSNHLHESLSTIANLLQIHTENERQATMVGNEILSLETLIEEMLERNEEPPRELLDSQSNLEEKRSFFRREINRVGGAMERELQTILHTLMRVNAEMDMPNGEELE